jgi:hypothetical protein
MIRFAVMPVSTRVPVYFARQAALVKDLRENGTRGSNGRHISTRVLDNSLIYSQL